MTKTQFASAKQSEQKPWRVAVFTYGLVCYALFHVTALLGVAFLGNFGLERTIDAEPRIALGWAIVIDVLLLSVFAAQHSIMARPAFKRWWTRFVPEPVERSTYVLMSNLALLLLYWQWQPIGGVVWHVESTALRASIYGIYALGWLGLVGATFAISHFDLFGMRQVYLYLRGREYERLPFRVPGPYRLVRHPIYVGWLTIFWAAPTMTVAHLLFAVVTTAYILVAIQLEERDLEGVFGDDYARYRREVPMLVPRRATTGAAAAPVRTASPSWGEALSHARKSQARAMRVSSRLRLW